MSKAPSTITRPVAHRMTGAVGSFGAWWTRVVVFARRAPMSVLVVGVLWLVGAATGSLRSGPPPPLRVVIGTGVGAVRGGRWWTVLTSMPWCAHWPGYVGTTVAVAVLLPVA